MVTVNNNKLIKLLINISFWSTVNNRLYNSVGSTTISLFLCSLCPAYVEVRSWHLRPSVRPVDRPSAGRSSVLLSVCPSIRPSVQSFVRSSVRWFIRLYVRLSARSSFGPSVHPSVRSNVRSLVCPSVCPSVRSAVHLPVRPSDCNHTLFCFSPSARMSGRKLISGSTDSSNVYDNNNKFMNPTSADRLSVEAIITSADRLPVEAIITSTDRLPVDAIITSGPNRLPGRPYRFQHNRAPALRSKSHQLVQANRQCYNLHGICTGLI